jgi:hypothetical protein
MARGEIERKVLELVRSVLGGSTRPTPDWLMRPGKTECGDHWSLICKIYRKLTGEKLPETMPIRERRCVDCVLKVGNYSPRIIEVDEVQHFNLYRAQTLRLYSKMPLAFDRRDWIEKSEAKRKLEGGKFGIPKPPLFTGEGRRHRQRAFRDALCDILPPCHGFEPTLRIGYFEVAGWLTSGDAVNQMRNLLHRKSSKASRG